MKKNKIYCNFRFKTIAFPLFLIFGHSIFFTLPATNKSYVYWLFFTYVLFMIILSIISLLWNIQYLIFKEDCFIFGNLFKKELYKVKYDNMIIIERNDFSLYCHYITKKEEPDKKKRKCLNDKQEDKFLVVYENKKKFNLMCSVGSIFTNLKFKKQIYIFYTKKIEDKFIEIQKQRGKKLDGSSLDDDNSPNIIDEEVKRVMNQIRNNNYRK